MENEIFKNKQKVTVIKTNFTQKTRLVEWMVKTEEENVFILAWTADDLGTALGITQSIPNDLVDKFCKDIEGKTINLVIEGKIKELPKLEDISTSQIHELSKELDKYGFGDVLLTMHEQQKQE